MLNAENARLVALLEELLVALERGDTQFVQRAAREALAGLRCGWLTHPGFLLDQLEEMAPESTRALEPLLLRRVFQQLGADQKVRMVAVLESQGWSVAELAEMAGCSASWIYSLRRLNKLPEPYRELLELNLVSEPQLRRVPGRVPRKPKKTRSRR